jgi:hypothetical protein
MKSLFILNSFTWSKAVDLAAADGEEANGDYSYVNFANITREMPVYPVITNGSTTVSPSPGTSLSDGISKLCTERSSERSAAGNSLRSIV